MRIYPVLFYRHQIKIAFYSDVRSSVMKATRSVSPCSGLESIKDKNFLKERLLCNLPFPPLSSKQTS